MRVCDAEPSRHGLWVFRIRLDKILKHLARFGKAILLKKRGAQAKLRINRSRCSGELRPDLLQRFNILFGIPSLSRWQGQLQLSISCFRPFGIGAHIRGIGLLLASAVAQLPIALSNAKHGVGPHRALGIPSDNPLKCLNRLPPLFRT